MKRVDKLKYSVLKNLPDSLNRLKTFPMLPEKLDSSRYRVSSIDMHIKNI